MADLTILSAHTIISSTLPSYANVSARHVDRASRSPVSNNPASSANSDGQQYDPSLLSPPLHTYRALRKIRRIRSVERRVPANDDSSVQSDDSNTENSEEASEEESDSAQFEAPHSYTRSFQPFAYPSTPNITQPNSHSQGGLRRPAPPLFRPKTFWRHTRRSALTGPSYSPSSYIVRRSTFIAAGLTLDKPHADLSALGVELRIGTISLVPSSALPL